MCGSFIVFGVIEFLDGVYGFELWRWFFIIEVVMIVGFVFFVYFVLLNYLYNIFWLKGEECVVVIWCLVDDDGVNDILEDN